MATASEDFKASALFLQSMTAGMKNASAALVKLKDRTLRWGATADGDLASLKHQDSLIASFTLTPKSASTVAQLPSTMLRKHRAAPTEVLTPTPRSRVSFHMPDSDDDDDDDDDDDGTPDTRSPFGKRLSAADRDVFRLFKDKGRIEHRGLDCIFDIDAELPAPKRTCSTASMASVASQGPCHMVLNVTATPKISSLEGSITPGIADARISFGV